MKKRTVIVAVSLAVLLAGSVAYASTRTGRSQQERDPGLSDDTNLEQEMIAALDDQKEAPKAGTPTVAATKAGRDQAEDGEQLSKIVEQ
ncbi:hypothetical protein [Geomonas sp.]|uniref:hypothetical protein n=1 Tax=Geomonas sp. TaxID=2651584 RepID=UPI002B481962|nr:hypothetical protein [Geomonas sp.]HJV35368.1 hypothetical protein [Geomonas sp.]